MPSAAGFLTVFENQNPKRATKVNPTSSAPSEAPIKVLSARLKAAVAVKSVPAVYEAARAAPEDVRSRRSALRMEPFGYLLNELFPRSQIPRDPKQGRRHP